MDMLGELKPILSTLAMPSCSLLLGIIGGLLWSIQRPKIGREVAFACVVLLWCLATPATSVWLSQNLLRQFEPVQSASLTSQGVQAIVVLGAGLEADLPDGIPQLKRGGLDRLRHAIELSRETGLPIAATGGRGWGSGSIDYEEATVTARVAQQVFGIKLRWIEGESRDTEENANKTFQMLDAERVNKIALVTNSWHMPRALKAFQSVGFDVIPAPMGYVTSSGSTVIKFLPTAAALENSTNVIRELLAISLRK